MLLCICLLVLLCSGCQSVDTIGADENSEFSLLSDQSDQSESAKEFATAAFRDSYGNYPIQSTAYGFVTEKKPIYLVGFSYEKDGGLARYGYKLSMAEDFTFSILEEGSAIGEFLFS